ncbi:carbon monoxide dehydrogenase [Mycolicibacterium moriokaense]|nr:carbon monoxide dehydrogenase [Mycolicibacterium moriokaense]
MELNNEFRVAVPAAKTWQVLTDVERVAPCIPGAQLLSVDGDDFTGAVKVKVGPITVSYKGEASFQEKDDGAQRVVIKAIGKETRGSGNAAALVTAQLKDEGDATHVSITTDLTISGKAAQFGRGVLADVSTNLIGQFARNLEADLVGVTAPSGAPSPSAAAATAAAAASGDGDSVDLLKVVAVPMAKRYAPAVAAIAAGLTVGFVLGRRKRRHPAADLADEVQAALAKLLGSMSPAERLGSMSPAERLRRHP